MPQKVEGKKIEQKLMKEEVIILNILHIKKKKTGISVGKELEWAFKRGYPNGL